LLSDDDLLGRVDAVNLEYVLGEIQTDRGNLPCGWLPSCDSSSTNHPMALDAGSGRRPPHQKQTHAPQHSRSRSNDCVLSSAQLALETDIDALGAIRHVSGIAV
jgi:hypothetical protein